jgi:hypothetical protein
VFRDENFLAGFIGGSCGSGIGLSVCEQRNSGGKENGKGNGAVVKYLMAHIDLSPTDVHRVRGECLQIKTTVRRWKRAQNVACNSSCAGFQDVGNAYEASELFTVFSYYTKV